ncbi:MAG: 5-dehydro-2-deoxygluconokinase [Alphaproteobacteria bacterium]
MAERRLDLITIGRAAVDLYGEQIGSRLEDMVSFAKYLGGCPANIAVGTARLGLKSAMITRVGDEHMGRFVRETLAAEGVDVASVTTDPKRLTALVILGIRDRDTFPLIFYRENCADMAIEPSDMRAEVIGSAKAILVTGTHFSTPGTDAACRHAIALAKQSGTRVIFDIDYRPVLWGLTSHGLGEERFIANDKVSQHLLTIVSSCDVIVGTEEEVHIAGGSINTIEALRKLRAVSKALIVMKRGPMGCVMFPGDIPGTVDEGILAPGFPVEVYNVLGAGDAFMSGFLSGWLCDKSLSECARLANACGALVVARHGCAPAMATEIEVKDFMARSRGMVKPRLDSGLNHLHHTTTRHETWNNLCILAFDHRIQFEDLAARYNRDFTAIIQFKHLVAEAFSETKNDKVQLGLIVDDRFGEEVLFRFTGDKRWIARPIELPRAIPLEFEGSTDVGVTLRAWPASHIVKCLIFYHPDDPDTLKTQQSQQLLRLWDAARATQHELLLEVIPSQGRPGDGTILAKAMQEIYDLGIKPDWWKLPPPDKIGWPTVTDVVQQYDPSCRGVLLLGLDASEAQLAEDFSIAATEPLCKGFAVGRSIFGDAAMAWFSGKLDDRSVVEQVAHRYRRLIDLWQQRVLASAKTA